MATLRSKRKLAAVSRETPESTRSGRTQSILDPELTQDYISQVSEEIEGRVTKKLSKEFSRIESRILGALSKLDEFLLNPQVRTCSVAVPGISRSNSLENQGTNEDRPSDDPGPEVEFSFPLSGAETDPHMVTGATDPHMVRGVTDPHSCHNGKLLWPADIQLVFSPNNVEKTPQLDIQSCQKEDPPFLFKSFSAFFPSFISFGKHSIFYWL